MPPALPHNAERTSAVKWGEETHHFNSLSWQWICINKWAVCQVLNRLDCSHASHCLATSTDLRCNILVVISHDCYELKCCVRYSFQTCNELDWDIFELHNVLTKCAILGKKWHCNIFSSCDIYCDNNMIIINFIYKALFKTNVTKCFPIENKNEAHRIK